MVEYLYPKAKEESSIEKLDENAVATKIIDVVENKGLTKAQAIGPVLDGSNDVGTFNKVWKELFEKKKKMKSVAIQDTVTKTKEELSKVSKYLDVDTWYNGLLEENDVSTFTALKEKLEPVVEKEVVAKEL